jgi:hypothetical protein
MSIPKRHRWTSTQDTVRVREKRFINGAPCLARARALHAQQHGGPQMARRSDIIKIFIIAAVLGGLLYVANCGLAWPLSEGR